VDVNKHTDKNTSPLYVVCQNNNIECLKILIENGADINKCKNGGYLPSHITCKKNNIECLKILIENGSNLNKCSNDDTSPLFIACQYNNFECLKILIENGADVNKCNDENTSPLFMACQENNIECVKILIENGADINKFSCEKNSPLNVSCHIDNIECVNILIKSNINIYLKNKYNKTAFYISHEKDFNHIILKFLQNGINIKYELQNAPNITNCARDYSYEKYIIKLNKYRKTELKLKYEFMNIICSNNSKSLLSRFFMINKGLRGNVGRRIISFVNAF
jgi:ankyrin repeat protein